MRRCDFCPYCHKSFQPFGEDLSDRGALFP